MIELQENLNSGNAATNTYNLAKGNHGVVQDTVPIDSTGEKMTVEIQGDSLISINIEAPSAADYRLDVGPDENTEFTDETAYAGTDIRDSFQLVDRYMSIHVTTAGASGDEATITIQEAR